MAKKDKNAQSQDTESGFSEIIKKFKQSPGIYIGSVVVLILVTVTFIGGDFISGGGLNRGGNDFVFGYYDKVPIAFVPGNFFSNNYQNISEMFQAVYQVDVSNPMIAEIIWEQAFRGTVFHTAVLQIMKRSGYTPSQKHIDRKVAELQMFKENGRFSPGLYRQIPETRRLSILNEMKETLTKQMFFDDYSSLMVSKGEAEFIASMSAPLRNFGMASFPLSDYPEESYREFAAQNSKLFDSLKLSMITISSSEKEAVKILESVKDGTTTFEDAARNHSQDYFANMGGDIGNWYFCDFYQMMPNASDQSAVFSLRKGELSNIFTTEKGWSFFRAESDITHANLDDETIMEKVRSYVGVNERGKIVEWAVARANEFSSDVRKNGFDESVNSRGMEMIGFGPLPMNYGSVELFTSLESFSISGMNAQTIASLARNESFWRTAFTTPIGEPSTPHVERDCVVVLFPFEELETDETLKEYVLSNFKALWSNRIDDEDTEASRQAEDQRNQSFLNYIFNSDKLDNQFKNAFNTYLRY